MPDRDRYDDPLALLLRARLQRLGLRGRPDSRERGRAIAAACGVGLDTWYAWRCGAKVPGTAALAKLIAALEVPQEERADWWRAAGHADVVESISGPS